MTRSLTLRVIPVIVRLVVPVFVIVRVLCEVAPTAVDENSRLVVARAYPIE